MIGGARRRARPGDQNTIDKKLWAQKIEQRAGDMIAVCGRHAPPVLQRAEPIRLGIGEPQPFAKPRRILLDKNAKRTEPAHRIGA